MDTATALARLAPVAALATLLASTASAGTAAQPDGTIAFLRNGQLFFMNPDGSGQRSAGTRADGFPAWSADGRRIAFAVPGRRSRIYVADARGRNRRPVTPAGFNACYSIGWAPKGQRIAYSRNDGCEGDLDIFSVNGDGKAHLRLTPGHDEIQEFGPVWSPNARTLLYWSRDLRARVGPWRLFRMRPDGRNKRVIRGVDGASITGAPTPLLQAWSRDGRRVFYIGGDGGFHVIHVIGAGHRRLTPRGSVVVAFALSPNRRQIALAAAPGENRRVEIFVMNEDGSGLRQVTNAPPGHTSGDPQWSSDGRRLVFTRRVSANAPSDIYAVNVDGTGETNLTRNRADDVAPAWAPRP